MPQVARNFIREMIIIIFQGSSEGYTKENGEYVIHYSAAPPLTTLKDDANSQGPNQYEILQVSRYF